MTDLYPPIEPHAEGWLDVGDDNEIYWQVCGNPEGRPAVFLHGGPGGGLLPDHSRLFDPDAYRIVLFDQRNCGRSRPHASDLAVTLKANTTWHLVDDVERLREHLGVDSWLVFGGSWGSTLGLAYAQRHPERVAALIVHGIYLARACDNAWGFTADGVARLFPEHWAPFRDQVPPNERDDLLAAYGRLLASPDPDVHLPAARAWCAWELSANTLLPVDPPPLDDSLLLAFARIEHHYFSRGCFLDEGQLLRDAGRIAHLPGVIVQGRYDMKTTYDAAWELHRAWPAAEFHPVEDAGHSTTEPGKLARLVAATDAFRE